MILISSVGKYWRMVLCAAGECFHRSAAFWFGRFGHRNHALSISISHYFRRTFCRSWNLYRFFGRWHRASWENLNDEYEVWLNRHASALEKKEKALQKQYNSEYIEAIQEYGADKAYWIGDNLVLRYDNCVILFKEDTTRSVLDSEACAAFFRKYLR